MKKVRLTTFSKVLIVLLVTGGLYGGFRFLGSVGLIPGLSSSRDLPAGVPEGTPFFNIGVVTWGGYAGGQYYNEGFEASAKSRFFKEQGIVVKFTVLDDFLVSREAFKSGDVDLLWVTVDAFPTESANLPDDPIFLFQADWSRGGDAIVVQRTIKSVNDLKGKKVAVAFGTPSHSFLLWMLKAAGMSYKSIEVVEVPNAIDAATAFKAGEVDAAVVWSPDDKDCVDKVKGAQILKNTKQASHIIADGFLVKKQFLQDNKPALKKLVQGWLTGAGEINQSPKAKKKAIDILATGLNISPALAENAINNVRLTTYGDNKNFFNLNPNYQGVKGEDLYDAMTLEYRKIGLIKGSVPSWRNVNDMTFVRKLQLQGPLHAAEKEFEFKAPSADLNTAQGFAEKKISINFLPNSAKLTENAKRIIDLEFGPISKTFAHSRIRIEGNTHKTGSGKATHYAFSKKRAKAVADYLVSQYGYSSNRFTIVGNGFDKPVSKDAAKNRRTDFIILN